MATRLKDLVIREISGVDKGAGEGTKVLIMKRADVLPKAIDALRASLVSIAEDDELTGAEKKAMAAQSCAEFQDHIAGQFQKSERIAFRKEEPMITQAETTASMVSIAKMVNSDQVPPKIFPRWAWNEGIKKAAAATRKAGESEAQAYTRFVTKDADGRAMFEAMSFADGPDHLTTAKGLPPTPTDTPSMARLRRLAVAHQAEHPELTPEQAFAAVYRDPDNQDLVAGEQHERHAAAYGA